MYPGPGMSGCSYTGSAGGAIVTDRYTAAFEPLVAVSATAASRERDDARSESARYRALHEDLRCRMTLFVNVTHAAPVDGATSGNNITETAIGVHQAPAAGKNRLDRAMRFVSGRCRTSRLAPAAARPRN